MTKQKFQYRLLVNGQEARHTVITSEDVALDVAKAWATPSTKVVIEQRRLNDDWTVPPMAGWRPYGSEHIDSRRDSSAAGA